MIAYFDLFAGVSGDMILGALVDAGLPVETLQETVAALGLSEEAHVTSQKTRKGFLTGTKVNVACHDANRENHGNGHEHPHRHLSDILHLIQTSGLARPVKDRAGRIFQRLGEAEAHVHGVALEEVHFHEVGAVDAIVDIVGAAAGLHALSVDRVICSPVPLSRGYAQSSHGTIPVPAPATAALLTGHPVYGLDIDVETVTPTGAAIITTLAEGFGPLPPMVLQRTGYGAGTLDLPFPNVLRLFLGEPVAPSSTIENQTLTLLSTNIDDMPGEWFGPLFDQLSAAGALDVWFSPIQMKKNRPAVTIHVLAEPHTMPALRLLLLRETTTLGVREGTVSRWCLPRETRQAETPWGSVRVKVARLPDGGEKAAPEFEDCRRLADANQVPLREVYQAALQTFGPVRTKDAAR